MAELRHQVSDATDEGNRMRLQSRLARLAGGVAVIRVGAATELELNERKDRIEDALHATRCAEKEGVVPGGGIALLRASSAVDARDDVGAKIIVRACEAPIRTLVENCGESPEFILKEVGDRSVAVPYGWNARTNENGDMYDMGIIDPLRVVRVALESAASVASLMLITHTLVSNGRDK